MKKSKSKYLTLAGLVLGTGVLLSACGNSSTASKTYNYVYSSDPSSLNYLAENRAATSDIVANLVDGLLENDQYGNIIPSLAEDWTVSQDGLTYTYKLRKDAKWFTSEGEEYAPVTAQDFVTGLQYAADKKSEALYLVQDSVAGLDDYITGKTSDFSTVSIKGKDFGEVVASKMVNYGKEWQGINFADGQDPYYNPEKAKAKFAEAKKELEAKGVQFPIHLDKTVEVTDKVGIQGVSSIKQSIESVLGSDNVVIDIQQLTSDEFDSSGYFAQTAAQKDYDLYHGGWGPDYQDPSTYLDIFNTNSGGFLQNLGLEPGEANDKAKAVGLDVYTQMLEEANKEQDPAKRYEKYADIQAWLIDSSLVLPSVSRGGTPSLRRTVPFAAAYGLTGTKGVESYKYLKVQDKIVTTDEYAKAREKWLKEKEESNKKAQEELAKHVK